MRGCVRARVLEGEGAESEAGSAKGVRRTCGEGWMPGQNAQDHVLSAVIQATKPADGASL